MISRPEIEQFHARLRDLARTTNHQKLADDLGVERWLLRNWVYQNEPNEWTVKSLKRKVDNRWKKLQVLLARAKK